MMKRLVMSALLVSLLLLPATVRAGVEPLPWRLSPAAGFSDPIFRLLFGPEAMAYSLDINTTDLTAPVFTVPANEAGTFLAAFDIQNALGPLTVMHATSGHQLTFEIYSQVGTPPDFTATFTLDGATSPLADVMFNASPAPTDFPDALGWATFTLLNNLGGPLPEGSPVDLTLRVFDSSGAPVALHAVPEPASVLLLGTGLIAAVRAVRRKRG